MNETFAGAVALMISLAASVQEYREAWEAHQRAARDAAAAGAFSEVELGKSATALKDARGRMFAALDLIDAVARLSGDK